MMLPIIVTGENAKEKRKKVVQKLEELEIETRPVLTGNFLAQPSIRNFGYGFPSPETFPIASKISDHGFMVGCHHDFSSAQIDYLAQALKNVAEELTRLN